MKRPVALVLALTLAAGCAELKAHAKSANDIARELCFLSASQQDPEALGGVAADIYCDDHFQEYLDRVLALQAELDQAAGFSRGDGGTD